MTRTINNQKIQIGTRVHCALYYCGFGTVFAIEGEQRPESIKTFMGGAGVMGGNAKIDVVFDNGSISRQLPEGIVRGIQWQIYDEVVGGEAIAEALANAAIVKAQKEAKAQAEREAYTAEVERLRQAQEYQHLKQGDDQYSGKLAGANMRAELKKAFPGVKFSVRMAHYGSVTVRWTDGPTEKAVEAIVGKYESGSFNGMEDIYEFSVTPWNVVFGGTKYAFCKREFSPELIAQAIDQVFVEYAGNLKEIAKPSAEDFQRGRLWSVRVPGLVDGLQCLINSQAYNMGA